MADVKSAAMKELTALLNAFDDHDEGDAALFRALLPQVLEEALPELGLRLVRPITSRTLKHLILTSPGRCPHPGWTAVLLRGLLHETDETLFEEGCRALVQVGGEAETDALRQVAWQRHQPALQAIVSRKLSFLEPRQPFSFHFRDMLLGSRQARLSTQAADHLACNAKLEHLPDLMTACDHPDNMASLHALRVIATIQRPEAGRFLMERFGVACDALMLDNWLRSAQEQIKRAPAQGVKLVVLELLKSCPGAGPYGAQLAEIAELLGNPEADALSAVQRLRGSIQGLKETRLVDCLADLALERSVRLANLMPEPLDEQRQRTQRLHGSLDACAEGMARFVRRGILSKQDVMPLFRKAYMGGAGGDGFGRSFAEILDDDDEASRELILVATNHHWREQGFTVLGERLRPHLLPFFLKAMGDPIVDIAQMATRYLGRLPGAFETAVELFRSGKADQMQQALNIFSLNGMAEAGPLLVESLEQVEREETLIGVIRCLGSLACQPAIEPLLNLLRGGQSSRLQRAVAESLMVMDSPEAARGLLCKAPEARNPEIMLLAIEAISAIRPDFQRSLQPDECQWVEQLLEACFEEGPGYRYRAILATQGLWTLDRVWLERLDHRVAAVIAEQRKRPTWDRDQQQAVSLALRELERKRREQDILVSSANPVRELVMTYTSGEAGGTRVLKGLQAALAAPGLVLGIEVRAELEALVETELHREGIDEASLEELVRIVERAGIRNADAALIDLLGRSGPRSSLRRVCLACLKGAGYPEERLSETPAPRDILVLEPSAFFRKRLAGALHVTNVREAQDREEAEALLLESPTEVLISESSDRSGDLQAWFAAQWRDRRLRQVLLSVSSRSLPRMENKPWVMGVLFKPYPMDDLLTLLGW